MATEETAAEWAARLTADDCETILHGALEAHDVRAAVAALTLMATKDPHRAERLLEAVEAGIAIARGEPVEVAIRARTEPRAT